MALDELVKDKGGEVKREREKGECPGCERKGKQRTEIEWLCTTDHNECSVITWLEWKTEMVNINE